MHGWSLAGLIAAALGLDALDGWLARRLGLVSAFGARFDVEIDALLLLILAAAGLAGRPGRRLGPGDRPPALWLRAGGALQPWLRAPLPPSRRRKAICAQQGVTLLICLLPPVTPTLAGAAAALALASPDPVVRARHPLAGAPALAGGPAPRPHSRLLPRACLIARRPAAPILAGAGARRMGGRDRSWRALRRAWRASIARLGDLRRGDFVMLEGAAGVALAQAAETVTAASLATLSAARRRRGQPGADRTAGERARAAEAGRRRARGLRRGQRCRSARSAMPRRSAG